MKLMNNKIAKSICSKRILIIFFLIGFVIRIFFIPLAVHADMLSATWRESLWVFRDSFQIANFSEIIISCWLFLIKPWLVSLPDMLMMGEQNNLSINQAGYQNFINSNQAMRYLFLLKFPYLLFDIGSLFVGIKIFQNNRKKIYYSIFWALNPFVIYASYVWGRYEVVGILLVILSLYFIRKYPKLSFVLLGVSIVARLGYVFIIPIYLIYASKNVKDYIYNSFLVFAPYIIYSKIISLFPTGGSPDKFVDYLFAGGIYNGMGTVSLFVLAYFAIISLMINEKNKQPIRFERFLDYCLLAMLSYFAFALTHPHYLAWLTPFFGIIVAIRPKLLLAVFVMFVSFMLLADIYWPYIATLGLFEVSNGEFTQSIYSLSNLSILHKWSPGMLRTIFNSIFVASILYISINIYIHRADNEQIK